ncbi:MAG TPA: S1C family serine protease [Phycisphaerales bacterium]|nr:S1C family serine protease [Phycisphaerales bacterium]
MKLVNLAVRHVVVLALSCWFASATSGQTAREVAKKVSPSVVLLVMEDSKGQPLAMGSGFVVKDGVIATNLHVIEGASQGYAKQADRKERLSIKGTVGIDAARDVVLLSVEDVKADALPMGDSKQVAVGDEIYAVGNPRGLEGTFSAGIISSIRRIGDDSLLQITAPISPGSSGGPVVNSKGEVIGVAAATFSGGQNLNFAIPSEYLSALASATTPTVPLGKAAAGTKQKVKSLFDDLGGRSTGGVKVEQLLWDLPGNAFNGEFSLSLRNELREPVRNVSCLLVFYGRDGQPVETGTIQYKGTIAAGLAKRVRGNVDGSVKKLTGNGDSPQTKLEFRILYFDLVTGDDTQDGRGNELITPIPGETPDPTAEPQQSDRPGVVRPQDAEEALRKIEKELAEAVAKIAPAGNGPDLIESKIDGEFSGWDGETIFKLSNGQIWQQVTYGYTYRYAYSPKVFIIKTNGAYKMKVDGVSSTIFVKQIK